MYLANGKCSTYGKSPIDIVCLFVFTAIIQDLVEIAQMPAYKASF